MLNSIPDGVVTFVVDFVRLFFFVMLTSGGKRPVRLLFRRLIGRGALRSTSRGGSRTLLESLLDRSDACVAYHSSTDDAYAVVTADGGFSIVVPDFASGSTDPLGCAFYRLRAGAWVELSRREVQQMVRWGGE